MKYYTALLANSIGGNPCLMYKCVSLLVFPHLPLLPSQPNIFPLSHSAAMRKLSELAESKAFIQPMVLRCLKMC